MLVIANIHRRGCPATSHNFSVQFGDLLSSFTILPSDPSPSVASNLKIEQNPNLYFNSKSTAKCCQVKKYIVFQIFYFLAKPCSYIKHRKMDIKWHPVCLKFWGKRQGSGKIQMHLISRRRMDHGRRRNMLWQAVDICDRRRTLWQLVDIRVLRRLELFLVLLFNYQ